MAKKDGVRTFGGDVESKSTIAWEAADEQAASALGVVVGGSLSDRLNRAVVAYNQAARLAVESGYLLLSVKAELPAGTFDKTVEGLGLSPQRAYELIRMAKFATALPAARREELMQLPKTKALLLASADQEVIDVLLEDGDFEDLGDLSVRELRKRIKALEAANVDLGTQLGRAEADLKAQEKKRKRAALDDEGAFVPMVVADVRLEMSALVKKAQLALAAMLPMGTELMQLTGTEAASEWVKPTFRFGLSGLMALRVELDGLIRSFVDAADDPCILTDVAPPLAYLDASEMAAIAEDWARLTALHKHEEALRKHEREKQRPKRGRPANAPEAPDAAKA